LKKKGMLPTFAPLFWPPRYDYHPSSIQPSLWTWWRWLVHSRWLSELRMFFFWGPWKRKLGSQAIGRRSLIDFFLCTCKHIEPHLANTLRCTMEYHWEVGGGKGRQGAASSSIIPLCVIVRLIDYVMVCTLCSFPFQTCYHPRSAYFLCSK
jgi:hypothetical protein